MYETYECWSGTIETPEGEREIEAFNAEAAAEIYAQHRYEDGDCDASAVQALDIFVKGKHGFQKFTIEIQMEPRFYATEVYD